MKKIKLLRVLVLLFGVANMAYIIYQLITIDWFYKGIGHNFLLGLHLKDISKDIMMLPILALIITSLNRFIKNGYFNASSAKGLKWAGTLLMIQAMFIPVADYLMYISQSAFFIILSCGSAVLPLCFGIGLIAIADFILKSNKLHEENQLTI